MIKLQSFWGSAPDPDGGAYSAPPYPLAGLRGGVAPSRTHPSCRKPPHTIPGYATAMCSLLSGMPILLNSVDSVFKILNFLDNTKFCAGNPDKVLVVGTSKCFLYMVVQVIVIALVKATCTDSFQECEC